jgi:PhnB protein
MNNAVKPIPEGYRGTVPYICVRGGTEAIDFYCRAFGATVTERIDQPDGRVGHAEIRIGAATIMLADEFPDMDVLSPRALGGTPVTLHLYVEDVDSFAARAIAEGLKTLRPVAAQFYGDRGGKFEDPFGHRWWIATRVEDVSHEEMHRRAAALFGSK